MKLYGWEIDTDKLEDAIREAYKKSIMDTTFDAEVLLNTETGAVYVDTVGHGSNFCPTSAIVLRKYTMYGWSAFRDWFTEGLSEDDINEWVSEQVGDDMAAHFCKIAEEQEVPMWCIAYEDDRIGLDDAVVREFMDDLLWPLDTSDEISYIVEEHPAVIYEVYSLGAGRAEDEFLLLSTGDLSEARSEAHYRSAYDDTIEIREITNRQFGGYDFNLIDF